MKKLQSLLAVLLIISTVVITGCGQVNLPVTPSQISTPSVTSTTPTTPTTPPAQSPIPSSSQPLTVSFLNVGQADCTVIQYGNSAMIIDAGGNSGAASLVTKLKNMDISKFDVVVGTHPHEDHIGGLDTVINNFAIGTIYMPKVSHNTKTFEDVLLAIKNKGLTVTTPVPGTSFTLGGDVQCTILAPNSQSYSELNSYSIVLKVTFNGQSFLFTGDAEVDSEQEMLAKGYDLKAAVLKVGHHGSVSSTSAAFLKAVSPDYAVIFVGIDNTYGHPHQETLDRLNATGVKIYRTDLSGGTIKFVVSGDKISVSIEK
ncbi:MAG: ComEC/Rec2 family competence protein [Chloroflexota bacterium]